MPVIAKQAIAFPKYTIHPQASSEVMTPGRRKIHALIVVLAGMLGAACTPTKPPVDELDAASRALSAARQAEATQYSATEYRSASGHLDQARAAERDQDYDAAAQFAAESQADSELALAKARLAKTRASVDKLTQDNANLDRDLAAHAPTEPQP